MFARRYKHYDFSISLVYCDLRSIWRPYGWGSVSVTSYNLHQQTELLIISTTTSGVFCLLTTDHHTTISQELKFNLRMHPCFQTVWSAAIQRYIRTCLDTNNPKQDGSHRTDPCSLIPIGEWMRSHLYSPAGCWNGECTQNLSIFSSPSTSF